LYYISRLSPESSDILYTAGLLTFPVFNTFPPFWGYRQWFSLKTQYRKIDIGITATGIVPDFPGPDSYRDRITGFPFNPLRTEYDDKYTINWKKK
jgi:hypothetical protein